jgi:hypothetical protein
VEPNPDRTPAGWPAALAILALVAVAISVHLAQKQRGLVIPHPSNLDACRPTEELVCTDVEHIERMLREEE